MIRTDRSIVGAAVGLLLIAIAMLQEAARRW